MADAKISQLPVATTPLAGTELVPVVQGGVTDQTTVEAILTGTVPSGTANGVLYLNGSKVVTSGTDLVFNATGLGIGTSSPGNKLVVYGSGGAAYIQVQDAAGIDGKIQARASTGLFEIGATSNNGLGFYTNNTLQATLDTSGNLGLGMTPSAWAAPYKVMQAGTTSFWGGQSGSEIVRVGTNAYNDGTWKYAVSGNFASIYQQSSGQHIWYNAPSWDGTGSNAISFTQAMTLDASGNLGVGATSAATYRARIYGGNGKTLLLDNNASQYTELWFANNGTTKSVIGFNNVTSDIAFLNTATGGSLLLGTNGSECARITSGGDFQTASGNSIMVGGTAARATTAGTNRVDIFDGTAPVGTLANGVSFYSASGEANVMDAAGNATLLSPHDAETNEWIFRSKHTPTGKVLKIDVERLLKFVNDHFGLDAVHEFVEA